MLMALSSYVYISNAIFDTFDNLNNLLELRFILIFFDKISISFEIFTIFDNLYNRNMWILLTWRCIRQLRTSSHENHSDLTIAMFCCCFVLMSFWSCSHCFRKSPQLRTWSACGPNWWNSPHLGRISIKRSHFPNHERKVAAKLWKREREESIRLRTRVRTCSTPP